MKNFKFNTLSYIMANWISGMWIDPAYPQLAASPDGLVNDPTEGKGLLEIKCPYMLRDSQPNDFSALSSSQQNSLCCKLDSCGRLQLKQSHAYYYQIQMQMGVVGMKFCDFVVWTCHGISIQRIYHDVPFWSSLRNELTTFHREYMAPEYFVMRIPRKLMAIRLPQ